MWLAPDHAEALLDARPGRNLVPTALEQQVGVLVEDLPALQRSLAGVAKNRAAEQLASHLRARETARQKGRVTIRPVLPVDILGAYVLLPLTPRG
jgi:hypothetical protein